jgi:hypothetical protein
MAQTRPEIKRIVDQYRALLVVLGIHPVQIYLYGSHAKTRDTWCSRSASPKTDPGSRIYS